MTSTATTTAPTTAAPPTTTVSAPTPTPTTATATATANASMNVLVLIFLGIFIIISIYCLVKSIMCFGKSGSTLEKIFGVIIAFFTGPFYLLYLNFNKGYCNDEEVAQDQQMVGGRRK